MAIEMDKENRLIFFKTIESYFSTLLQCAVISNEGKAAVQHFIDVGEYGLALEIFVETCHEENIIASDVVKDIVIQLSNMMNYDHIKFIRMLS